VRHSNDRTPIATAAAAGLWLLLAGGCALLPSGAFGPVDAAHARPMPADLAQEQTLDIQVFRNGTRLVLTNSTARTFEDATLWVNRRFSMPIERFEIGQTLNPELRGFVDEFGVPFRAGGFFATEPPDPVVLVQLEDGGAMHGLVVTGNRIR